MSDFDDEPTEPRPAGGAGARPDGSGATAKGKGKGPNAAKGDDWDDDWDDDDWDDRGSGSGPGGRKDLTIPLAILAAVLAIVLVVVLTQDSGSDSDDAGGNDTPAGSTAPAGGEGEGPLCGNWPAAFGGDGSNVASGEGVYVWSDFGGIHVRSNGADPVVVKIVASSTIKVASPGDGVETSAESGTEITATLPAGAGTAGPDLDVPCDTQTIGFEVTKGGAPVDAATIKVGGSGTAEANPASFTRDPA